MNKLISVAAILALTAAKNPYIKTKPLHDLPTNVADDYDNEMYGLLQPKFTNSVINKVYHDDEQMIRIDPKELRPHYRTFAPLSADDDEFFVDFAHDDEQMRIDPREPRLHRPTFSPLVDKAHDDEQMIWKYDPARAGTLPPMYADDAEDEFFVDNAHDDEQMIWKPDLIPYPRPTRPFIPLYADAAEDEFFVDNAHDDEQMIWKYDPTRTGSLPPMYADDAEDEFFVDNAHDDEQMIWKYDPARTGSLPPVYADDAEDEFFAAEDEFFNVEKAEGKIHEGIKKARDYIAKHPEVVKQAQRDVKNLAGMLKKLSQDQKNGIPNEHLPILGQLIKEGRTIYNEVKAQRTHKKPEVHDNNLFLDEIQDNDLSIKDKLKGAANWVGDHPKVISETAKAVKTLRGGK